MRWIKCRTPRSSRQNQTLSGKDRGGKGASCQNTNVYQEWTDFYLSLNPICKELCLQKVVGTPTDRIFFIVILFCYICLICTSSSWCCVCIKWSGETTWRNQLMQFTTRLSLLLHLTSHDDEDGDNGSGDEEDYDNYDLVEWISFATRLTEDCATKSDEF